MLIDSIRSLHAMMLGLILTGLVVTSSVIMAMMTNEIGRTRSERLSAQLDTATQALVSTLEQRLSSIRHSHVSTVATLSMDPSLAVATPAVTALSGDAAKAPLLNYARAANEVMLAAAIGNHNFNGMCLCHRNYRINGWDNLLGRTVGIWNYIEAAGAPWNYLNVVGLGQTSSDELASMLGLSEPSPYLPSPGKLDELLALDDFRSLDESVDWGAVEVSTGHSLGRVQLMVDGTLLDHGPADSSSGSATCGTLSPAAWPPSFTREAAVSIGCQIAHEGTWTYNATGALELTDTSTGDALGQSGERLTAGTFAPSSVGAWRLSYKYGQPKYAGPMVGHYMPYDGRTRPYFMDKSVGGVIDHSVADDYGWYGPYAIPGRDQLLLLTAVSVVHTRVDSAGQRLAGGASSFAATLITDTNVETISTFLTEYVDSLDAPEASKPYTVAFVVTEPDAGEPRRMVAVNTLRVNEDGVNPMFSAETDSAVYACNPLCGPALMNESAHPLIAVAASDVTRRSFTYDGATYLMKVAPYDAHRLRLLVGIIVPEEPYTEQSRQRTRTVTFVAVGVSVSILLLWLALQGALIVRPLSQVSRGIKAMGDMRLDDAARLAPRTTSVVTTIDELLRGFHDARRHLLAWREQETRRRVELELEKAERSLASVVEAKTSASQLMHPMVLVSAATFVELGALVSYEDLRLSGKLTFLDTLEQLTEFKATSKVIFLSHQWLGWGAPDPGGVHYAAMVRATRGAIEMLLPGAAAADALAAAYVWVDFGSIAQRHRGMQVMAISSLPVYAAFADAFVVVAPSTTHAQTGAPCGLDSYNTRLVPRRDAL